MQKFVSTAYFLTAIVGWIVRSIVWTFGWEQSNKINSTCSSPLFRWLWLSGLWNAGGKKMKKTINFDCLCCAYWHSHSACKSRSLLSRDQPSASEHRTENSHWDVYITWTHIQFPAISIVTLCWTTVSIQQHSFGFENQTFTLYAKKYEQLSILLRRMSFQQKTDFIFQILWCPTNVAGISAVCSTVINVGIIIKVKSTRIKLMDAHRKSPVERMKKKHATIQRIALQHFHEIN